jgi:hypothetical protein
MDMENQAEAIRKALSTSPYGTFKLFRGDGTGVDETIEQHMKNHEKFGLRIKHAKEVGCWIEVISLRLQVIDYWLRVYFVNRAPIGNSRRREFGRLLEQCRELGLENNIFNKLRVFNEHRINAIHGFIVGRTDYETLKDVVLESESLVTETIIHVLDNTGIVITSLDGNYNVGDMILNVETIKGQFRLIPNI